MSFIKIFKTILLAIVLFSFTQMALATGDVTVSLSHSHFIPLPYKYSAYRNYQKHYQSLVVNYGIDSSWSVYAGMGTDGASKLLKKGKKSGEEAEEVGRNNNDNTRDQIVFWGNRFFAGFEYALPYNSLVTPVLGLGLKYENGKQRTVPRDYWEDDFSFIDIFIGTYTPANWFWVEATYDFITGFSDPIDVQNTYVYASAGLDWKYKQFNVGFDLVLNYLVLKLTSDTVNREFFDGDGKEEYEGLVKSDLNLDAVSIQANVSVGYVF